MFKRIIATLTAIDTALEADPDSLARKEAKAQAKLEAKAIINEAKAVAQAKINEYSPPIRARLSSTLKTLADKLDS